jgi:hypothetical protein
MESSDLAEGEKVGLRSYRIGVDVMKPPDRYTWLQGTKGDSWE